MTALSRAQQVLENDKDFEYLTAAANKITTGTMWDSDAEEVVKSWESVPYFHKKYIEEFIAWYKAVLCFAIAISELLNEMHVEDNDPSKMYKIPGTYKIVNIYSNPRPGTKRFKLNSTTNHMYNEEEVSVEENYKRGTGTIRFILEEPVLTLDPVTATYKLQYMESIVRIEIEDEKGGKTFKEFRLKDININKVLETINAAGLL